VFIILLLLIVGCKNVSNKVINTPLSDKEEVALIAYEYAITNKCGPSETKRIYVDLDARHLRLLRSRLPHCNLRGIILDTNNPPREVPEQVISLDGVEIHGSTGVARAIYLFEHGSANFFRVDCMKTSGWTITNLAFSQTIAN
jgi:hypothetical protein